MIDLHNALIAGRMLGGSGSPAPEPTLITKSITANGVYSAEDDNADGYSAVSVEVPEKVLTTKTITENGTYAASSDNADGYSAVTVNTPEPNNIDIFHTENMLWGVELNQQGGTSHSSDSTFVSDYLDVGGYEKLHILRRTYRAMCFYDANKSFILYTDTVQTGFVNIPTGAKYMRFNSQGSAGQSAATKIETAVIVFNE